MMRALGFQLVAVLAFSAVGCVPSFDDNLSTIEEPKVLAVQAEPAEAAPGETVQLSALVASPELDAKAPKLVWGLCTARKPLTELGPVNTVCIQAPSGAPDSIVALGSGAAVQATLPMDACRLFGPSLPEPMNGEPAGRPVDPDPTGGFYQPVTVTLLADDVTTLGAVRIFCPPSGLDQEQAAAFNSSYHRNQNPALDSISTLNGARSATPIPDAAPLQVSAGQVLNLQGAWAACSDSDQCTGAETYVVFNLDTRQLDTHHESLRISWYATAGTFSHSVTGRDENEFASTTTENTWTAPSQVGDTRLWLVIRDSRGGQSFQSFVVSVRP